MALIGTLTTPAEVHSLEIDTNTMTGTGEEGSELGVKNGGIAAAQLAADAVTTAKILDANVTAAKLASNSVTTIKIADSNVTTAKIADDAVTADKIAAGAVGASELASTAVTPGSYTNTDLTVDADGRITAASNGSAGGGGFSYDSLTSGSFTVLATRSGSSAITLVTNAVGDYTIVIPSGSDLVRADIFTNNSSVISAGTETLIDIDNSANSRARRVDIRVILANTGSEEAVMWTETVAANVTSITLPDMNGNGANGYRVLLT